MHGDIPGDLDILYSQIWRTDDETALAIRFLQFYILGIFSYFDLASSISREREEFTFPVTVL